VSTAAVAALFLFQRCSEPKTEPIIETLPLKSIAVCVPPDKTDGKCEPNKGERDSLLGIVDPTCALCGDGKLTEPETSETCPVDALCGNGKKDQGTFPAMVKAKGYEGKGVYTPGSVIVNECDTGSKFSCEADCPKEEAKKDIGHRRVKEPKESTEPAAPVQKSTACPNDVQNSRNLLGRVVGSITRKAGALRNELGVGAETVQVKVKVAVDSSGVPSIKGNSVSCEGVQCPNSVDAVSFTGLNMEGIFVPAPGFNCTFTIPVNVPGA
jgi:hypothetical protein